LQIALGLFSIIMLQIMNPTKLANRPEKQFAIVLNFIIKPSLDDGS
jgi:hypothetical protein